MVRHSRAITSRNPIESILEWIGRVHSKNSPCLASRLTRNIKSRCCNRHQPRRKRNNGKKGNGKQHPPKTYHSIRMTTLPLLPDTHPGASPMVLRGRSGKRWRMFSGHLTYRISHGTSESLKISQPSFCDTESETTNSSRSLCANGNTGHLLLATLPKGMMRVR